MNRHRIRTLIRQFAFTLLLILSISLCSAATSRSDGSLYPDNVSNLGLAPRHLVSGELVRVITSVFLTHDWSHLTAAVVMASLAVGGCEFTLGTKVAVCTFSLSHLTSVLIFAVGIGFLHWMQLGQTISTLYSLHDVGPSAGYYGCLSRTIVASKIPSRRMWTISLFAVLTVRTLVSFFQMPDSQIRLSADVVHLIAASVGVVLHALFHQNNLFHQNKE